MESTVADSAGSIGARPQLWPVCGVVACAVLLTGVHCWAIYTDSINWDEFALFHRTQETIRTHILFGGGRPGLGTLLMLPLVRGCRDTITVAHHARWLTALATLAFYAGLYSLLRRLFIGIRQAASWDAAFGVALIACVPIVVRWSVQARTDQWALACASWAGVALLASQSKPHWSWLAGALLGLGYLFSQKAAYIAGLAGLLAMGRQFVLRELDVRRECRRVLYCLLGVAFVILGFHMFATHAFDPPPAAKPSDWSDYAFYQAAAGHRVYLGILLTLGPHVVVGALAVAASLRCRTALIRRQLALAAAVLVLGLAVGVLHPSAFAYFWMTLGVFPAVAGALLIEPIRGLFSGPSTWNGVYLGLWLTLLIQTVPTALSMSQDTQRVQREALAFVDKNFDSKARGFHPEGALSCRHDSAPFPVYFSSDIANRFRSQAAITAFAASFVERPVAFIVTSYRLLQFPYAIQRFWSQHYVLYGPGVLIPGFVIGESQALEHDVKVLVPGRYRWQGQAASSIHVDERSVRNGETVWLAAGPHHVQRLSGRESGALVLAVASSPSPSIEFYSESMIRQLDAGF